MKTVIVKKDTYYDSVFLMQVTAQLKGREGVSEVQVTMATPQNRELLANLGFTQGMDDAGPNDLVIAIDVGEASLVDTLQGEITDLLKAPAKEGGEGEGFRPSSLAGALEAFPGTNLAIISVAGQYAGYEARKALERGLHVMLFSDNVSLDEEIAIKQRARECGLLVMGPDCGTAIINGAPLCFANEVRQGSVGIVAASGTGAQEVSVLIDRNGGGCSQVIGTGGRDLSKDVGGATMLMGIEALARDPATSVIVVVSKPPAPEVAEVILAALADCGKPAVVHFIGRPATATAGNVKAASCLEEAALLALSKEPPKESEMAAVVEQAVAGKRPEQKHVRGYFTGGTLCDEALFILQDRLSPVYSNIHPDQSLRLQDPTKSQGHTLVDLGDDTFTRGRPHPMIEPATRVERMEAEVDEKDVAVVLLDVVLGHGSHHDPAGALVPVLEKYRERGNVTVLASVVGTDRDYQNLSAQRAKLEEQGVVIMPSNAQMARLALNIVEKLGA